MIAAVATPAVPGWVWTLTTASAAVFLGALTVILVTHVLVSIGSLSSPAAQRVLARLAPADGRRSQEEVLRRRLIWASIPLLVCFVAVVLVRLGIILAERPGP